MNDSETLLVVYSVGLTIAFLATMLFLFKVMDRQEIQHQTEVTHLQQMNSHLTNLLASKGPLEFQTIVAATNQTSLSEQSYVPMDDFSEWQRTQFNSGLGEELYQEDQDGEDARGEFSGL